MSLIQNMYAFFTSGNLNNFTMDNFAQDYNVFRNNVTTLDLYVVFISLYFHIKLRYFICDFVIKSLLAFLKVDPINQLKASDSGYKLVFHLTSTLLGIRILFRNDCKVCFNSFNVQEFAPDALIAFDVRVFYVYQMGYYLFAIYSDQILAPQKKTIHSLTMKVHHVVTLALIIGSYITRAHHDGTVIAFLHHTNDIFIELAKVSLAMKIQNGKVKPLFQITCDVSCFLIPVSWVIARLYYYPLVGLQWAFEMPPYLSFTILKLLLLVILIMNVIWAVFVIRWYYKVFTKQKEIEDPLTHKDKKMD